MRKILNTVPDFPAAPKPFRLSPEKAKGKRSRRVTATCLQLRFGSRDCGAIYRDEGDKGDKNHNWAKSSIELTTVSFFPTRRYANTPTCNAVFM